MTSGSDAQPTTAALIHAYVDDRLRRGELARSSVDVVRPVLRQWARHVDGAPPGEWTTDQVASWVVRTDLSASTLHSRLSKLRPFVRWLRDRGYLEQDPTREIGKIVVPDGSPRDLTPEEVSRVIAAAPDKRALLVVLLMAHCGLRCGDVARIRVEDVDARRRSLHVRAKGGRGGHTHWEPIPLEAWEVLVSWLRATKLTAGALIRSYQHPERGLRPATIGKLVVGLMWDAGVKEFAGDGVAAHSLRHTCAQHMLDRGADIRQVQKTLGHKSIRSTEWYTRREPLGLREAMEGRSYRPAA